MSPVTTYIVETFLTLVGVVVLAVLVLYGARRLGVGRPLGPLELMGRLPLEGRRVVYLVRVGRAAFVVGASERGLTRLGEVDATMLTPAARGAGAPLGSDAGPMTAGAAPGVPLAAPVSDRATSFAEKLASFGPHERDRERPPGHVRDPGEHGGSGAAG
jgi:hypothetical protein